MSIPEFTEIYKNTWKHRQPRYFFLKRKSQTYAKNTTFEHQRVLFLKDIVATNTLQIQNKYATNTLILLQFLILQLHYSICQL